MPANPWPRAARLVRTAAAVAAVLTAATRPATMRESATPRVDAAFESFWEAAGPEAAAHAVGAVLRSGATFDDVLARLKKGRSYSARVSRGVVKLVRHTPERDYPYTLDVPQSYDPQRGYQVRVQLHGGVMRPTPVPRGDGSVGALAGVEQIYVLPQSWAAAPWWAPSQLENVHAILDEVKRTYNVDENRVALVGISDGGTAAYYFAMRDTTPYASFLPLIGFIMVLRSPDLELDGALFPNNLRNKPFFVVNTGKDRLYPTARIEPVLRELQARGLSVTYRPQPDNGHDTTWWPHVKDELETFVADHRRTPHPSTLTWQTDETATRNRAHWLVIDALAPVETAETRADLNDSTAGNGSDFGLRTVGMRITAVVPSSNAAGFGFQAGDVVTAVNRRTLPAHLDLADYLDRSDPGTTLTFRVMRGVTPVELQGTYRPAQTPRVSPLFPTLRPSGRVDVTRQGNTITATTRGVAAFTLLLSPDVIDFTRPVTVVADGRRVFEGRVPLRVETLLKWASRDNDRTMLYGAELAINLPRSRARAGN